MDSIQQLFYLDLFCFERKEGPEASPYPARAPWALVIRPEAGLFSLLDFSGNLA
jgi:hypothetical protein